jgi:hypothetical protein
MKKTLALVSFLLLAIACAAPPTNRDLASDTNRAANVAAPPPTTVALSEADAIAKEKAIWDTIQKKDYDSFANMLADDQVEVLDAGVWDKAGSIAGVKEFEPTAIAFSNWKYVPISKNVVLVTYTVNVKGKYKGKEFPASDTRGSSAWANRNGKWLAVFHQESGIKPPPPPPRAKPAASPSPAAPAPAIVIGSDPIANEKAIWEALKHKNYEGFASALAADSIEVEPVGVFDKAATVKAVSEFDFSKAELTDFKATPLDDESALVTYTMKMPGTPQERHSTIWSKRDGKWMAVFHQGTEVPKVK